MRLHWLILIGLLSFAPVAFAEPVSSVYLSRGKFYTYSVAPSSSYPDHWGMAGYTDGVRMGDEVFGGAYPWTNWVGWYSQGTVDIVLDLGKSYVFTTLRVHSASQTSGGGIKFPSTIKFYKKTLETDSWTQWGGDITGPTDTSGFSSTWIAGNGTNPSSGRYIKISLTGTTGAWMFVDEVEVLGYTANEWKGVPRQGCYIGSYPGEFNEGTSANFGSSAQFESLVRSTSAMALWYASVNQTTAANISSLYTGSAASGDTLYIDSLLGDSFRGFRHHMIGMLSVGKTAEQIASGTYDTYFQTLFGSSGMFASGARGGSTDPLWFRFLNEMNGSWVTWTGDPTNYRIAWRRVYNIAERLGVSDKLIWVWSPAVAVSGASDSAPYYPGDHYVDWFGLSVYPATYFPDNSTRNATDNLPCNLIEDAYYGTYATYADRKPFMISEGAYGPQTADKVAWIKDLFSSARTLFPMMKAIVWENHGNLPELERRVDFTADTQAAFTLGANHPYFIPTPIRWEKSFANISGNVVGNDGWLAVADGTNTPTAWQASHSKDGGWPAAYISGPSTGKSDLYAPMSPVAGDAYAIIGELVDFATTPSDRNGTTRVYFENDVDGSGNLVRSGWSVGLSRYWASSIDTYDSLVIYAPDGTAVATKNIGAVTSKYKAAFSFKRQGSNVSIELGDLRFITTETHNPQYDVVRINHYQSGTGTTMSELGVTGLVMSAENASREDFSGVNGSFLDQQRWWPTAESTSHGAWKADDWRYSSGPAAYFGNTGRIAAISTSGIGDLFTDVPVSSSYSISGNLLNFDATPDAASTGTVYFEADVGADGTINRKGWGVRWYRVFSSPTSWYDGYQIVNPSGSSVASQYVGDPSGVTALPFSFTRSGSSVTITLGSLTHNVTETFDSANTSLRLTAYASSTAQQEAYFGVSGLAMSGGAWGETFHRVNAPVYAGRIKWYTAAASYDDPGNPTVQFANNASNLLASDTCYTPFLSDKPAGKTVNLTDGKYEVFTTVPAVAQSQYKVTGTLINANGTTSNRGEQARVYFDCAIDAVTGAVSHRGWSAVLLKTDDDGTPLFTIQIRDDEDDVLATKDLSPIDFLRVPFLFERNGSTVRIKVGTTGPDDPPLVWTSTNENYNSTNNKVSLYVRPDYVSGGAPNNGQPGFFNIRILY
jgi:hypothetical protein